MNLRVAIRHRLRTAALDRTDRGRRLRATLREVLALLDCADSIAAELDDEPVTPRCELAATAGKSSEHRCSGEPSAERAV